MKAGPRAGFFVAVFWPAFAGCWRLRGRYCQGGVGCAQGCSEFASDAAIDNTASHALHHALGFVETERVVFFRKAVGALGAGKS